MQHHPGLALLLAASLGGWASACGSAASPGGAGTGGAGGGGGLAATGGSGGRAGAGGSIDPSGSGGTGGANPQDGGTAGSGGAPGGVDAATDQGGPDGGRPVATCSEAVLRTAPPAGKEALKTAPADPKFPFSTHWMGRFSDNPSAVGITGMADFDNDGDLDFASGQRGGPMFWWEYCSPDHWVQHSVGTGHSSPGGGNAVDVDGDGWVDLIAGDSWYRNPKTPRQNGWMRFPIGVTGGGEDIAVGDLSGDGKPDVLWVWSQYDPQWRQPGPDPTAPWPLAASLANRQTQGGAIGDLDGDKDNDIVVGNQWWYRNLDGLGTQWAPVRIAGAFDDSPMTNIGDIDGDGDMDIVMCTHFGNRAAWVENVDGMGTQWTLRLLASNKRVLHSIFALDFDNDGDLDVYSGESTGTAWIWENSDGRGTFVEHAVARNARGHDARVGDVDCDGDLDIAGKPWGEMEAEPRDHVYLRNMTVEMGGRAVFTRPAGEVWHKVQDRECP